MTTRKAVGAFLCFSTVAAVPSSKALLRKHVQETALVKTHWDEDLGQDASPLGIPSAFGLYASDINFTQSPTMLTHFLDAKQENLVFLMNQGFSYKSKAPKCAGAASGCNNCIKPLVNISESSFVCVRTVDGQTVSKPALLEYNDYTYNPDTYNEAAICAQYHLSSNFVVSCGMGAATLMKLERYNEKGELVQTYPEINIPRHRPKQNLTKLNLVGCLMFSAAYSSWSMLFAQLAFQRLQGFDHTLIYDNSPPSIQKDPDYIWSLAKLKLWKNHVTRIPWASSYTLREDLPNELIKSLDTLSISEYTTYAHCHYYFRGRANWIANNHVDEFMAVQPSSPYADVADALRPLPPNVNSLLISSQQVVVPQTIGRYSMKLIKEYLSSEGTNVVHNDDLFFDFAASGKLWHSAGPKEWVWQGIYRPESISFLDAQGAKPANPSDETVVSDPLNGVVTQHVRVDAAGFRFNGSAPAIMDTDQWDQYCLKDTLPNTSSRKLFYSIDDVKENDKNLRFLNGVDGQRVKCVFEEMRWVGQFGDCVRRIIQASGLVPKDCKKHRAESLPNATDGNQSAEILPNASGGLHRAENLRNASKGAQQAFRDFSERFSR